LELDSGVSDLGTSGVTTHVNKVHHLTTITRVAEQLGEDEDWLRDVASEMQIEDGVIWVYGAGEGGVLAFTDFGIESLIELINTKTILRCSSVTIRNIDQHAAYAGCLLSAVIQRCFAPGQTEPQPCLRSLILLTSQSANYRSQRCRPEGGAHRALRWKDVNSIRHQVTEWLRSTTL
jgi:hypothetical protein